MTDPLTALIIGILILATALYLFFPEKGVFWKLQKARKLSERVLGDDVVKHIHRQEMKGQSVSLQSIAGALQVTVGEAAHLVSVTESRGLIKREGENLTLTDRGRELALHLVRAHRLWETYLADMTGAPEQSWHEMAERREHEITMEEADKLAAKLGYPTHDPHGDPIPGPTGDYVPHGGQPITQMEPGRLLRIVHIEDEPDTVYAQLVAEGLHPGMHVRLMEVTPERVRFWAEGDEYVLAPVVACNISTKPVPEESGQEIEPGERLSSLKTGEEAVVTGLSPLCRGVERRRFFDLGILPGTNIKAEFHSAGGDPIAYRVRSALVALRKAQADMIRISRQKGVAQR